LIGILILDQVADTHPIPPHNRSFETSTNTIGARVYAETAAEEKKKNTGFGGNFTESGKMAAALVLMPRLSGKNAACKARTHMEARGYWEQVGQDTVAFYGASITEADLIMTDGKSLEHTGVTPDQLLLPSPYALANGRDPVLARAAETLGVKISPEEAGKLFPYEWPPE
jgi:hypothetical protein